MEQGGSKAKGQCGVSQKSRLNFKVNVQFNVDLVNDNTKVPTKNFGRNRAIQFNSMLKMAMPENEDKGQFSLNSIQFISQVNSVPLWLEYFQAGRYEASLHLGIKIVCIMPEVLTIATTARRSYQQCQQAFSRQVKRTGGLCNGPSLRNHPADAFFGQRPQKSFPVRAALL